MLTLLDAERTNHFGSGSNRGSSSFRLYRQSSLFVEAAEIAQEHQAFGGNLKTIAPSPPVILPSKPETVPAGLLIFYLTRFKIKAQFKPAPPP